MSPRPPGLQHGKWMHVSVKRQPAHPFDWQCRPSKPHRVVPGDGDRRIQPWDPSEPETSPTQRSGHRTLVYFAATLTDGRVITGGLGRRVLVWDLSHPEASPSQLGCYDEMVLAATVLADGRIVTGGSDGRVLVWGSSGTSAHVIQLNCSVAALATLPSASVRSDLVIAHQGSGFSLWSLTDDHHEIRPLLIRGKSTQLPNSCVNSSDHCLCL